MGKSQNQPIRCKQTGEVFPSKGAVCRKYSISLEMLNRLIATGEVHKKHNVSFEMCSTFEYSEKACKFCGKMFRPADINQDYCLDDYAECIVCGQPIKIQRYYDIPSTCSRACANKIISEKNSACAAEAAEKRRATNEQRYGPNWNAEIQRRAAESCQAKFGGPSAFCSPEVRKTARDTIFARFGDHHSRVDSVKQKKVETSRKHFSVDNPTQSAEVRSKIAQTMEAQYGGYNLCRPEVQERSRQTTEDKYGVPYFIQSTEFGDRCTELYGAPNPMQSEEIRHRCEESNLQKYGVPFFTQTDEMKAQTQITCQQKYQVPWPCMTPQCREASATVSKINKAFSDLLSSHGVEHEMEFPLGRYSYDFYIPSSKLLIEIDPTWTHNSYLDPWNIPEPLSSYLSTETTLPKDCVVTGLPKDYHLNKSKFAESQGYRCIHVFDWDSWETVVKMIKPKKTLYARNGVIRQLDKKTVDKFADEFHLQGKCIGQEVNFGIFFLIRGPLGVEVETLVQIMTFGTPRYNKKFQYELLRLCTRSGYSVVGGAERLWKHFIKTVNPASVISYCDAAKFSGEVYRRIGMKLDQVSQPTITWWSDKTRKKITNNLLLQRGFDQLLGSQYGTFGPCTDNQSLMIIQTDFLPVYDCGQQRWVWFA